ncbi:glyoxalase/bleomycin resistance/extradiol dioxygenase family protein [Sebaldella sp. S0638]|uniref:VOC family protein n=1 Tax=Sebaldella sp. S0638 TaxID=2957809 RepID=UPI0020A15775|nr:VOC family protein [Sebaldella sp. S0638]MCP1225011.1 VOC family protein [Sebaldella sp. S0638]
MKDKLTWFENVEERVHPWEGLGIKWLTAAISVTNVQRAVDFYTGIMGMIAISELEDDNKDLLFARIRYRGVNFVINKEGFDSAPLSPESSGQVPPFIFYLYVDNVKELAEKMLKNGAVSQIEISETPWGDLRARLRDPFGYVWDIAQKI